MSTVIYKKLLEIKKKVPYLQKDKKGFNYTYVTPTQVCATLNPLLNECGLILITNIIDSKSYEVSVPTKNDPNKREWKFDLDIIFTWADVETGDRVDIAWKSSGCNGEDKGLGSALTYAERYFMLKQFNIPTDNDDPDNFQNKYATEEEKLAKEKNKPKPVATASQMKVLLKQIEDGDVEAANRAQEKVSFTPQQRAQVSGLILSLTKAPA
jgi:hypothetical protein